jgi:PAS domain S-box-containing protein
MDQSARAHKADDLLHVVAPIVVIGFTLAIGQWQGGRAIATSASAAQIPPVEATGFILLGLALLFFQPNNSSRVRRRLVQLSALAVIVIGALSSLSHFAFAANLDSTVFHLPVTSASLLLLAAVAILSLTITRLRPHKLIATWLAAVLMISAALTVVGNIFGHPGFFHQQHLTTMPLQTALLFSIIALDVLRLSRIKPLKVAKNAGLISIAFIVIVLAGMVVGSIQESRHIQAQMDKTTAISRTVQGVISGLNRAESSQRGYIITYNQSYYNSYKTAVGGQAIQLEQLRALTNDNSELKPQVDTFADLTQQKLHEMDTTIQQRRLGFWVAVHAVDTNEGYNLMSNIEGQGQQLQQTAQRGLSNERYQQQINNHHTMAAIFIGTITNLVLIGLIYLRLTSENRQRNLAQARLRTEKNDALNARAKSDAILESIGDGVIAIDPNGYIVLFNNAASELTGFSAEEALGKQYREIIRLRTYDGKRRKDQFITQALRGEHVKKPWLAQLLPKDETLVTVTCSAAPITDAQGQTQGTISVFRKEVVDSAEKE